MTTKIRCAGIVFASALAWATMTVGAATALAEGASGAGKKASSKAAAKKDAAKAAPKAAADKKDGKTKRKGKAKKKGSALAKMLKPKKSSGPIKISKPIWNKTAGFGLPVPPGWSGKVDGSKIVLKSPGDPASQTIISMGPEPTEQEASQYIGQLCKKLAEEKKILPMPQPPVEVLDMTIYVAGYADSSARPPGIGAMLVMDRPGDQVFVIRVLTRDQSLMKNTAVLASLGMITFRGESPLARIAPYIGIGKVKKKLKLGEVKIKPGSGTLAEFRLPQVAREIAKKIKCKGELHRYRLGIATPKGYNANQSWPVLLVDAPATDESIARYQKLSDATGMIVLTVEAQSEDTIWPPEVRARAYFSALGKLDWYTCSDRSCVYVMGSGANAANAQTTAAILPLARGVICHDATEDGLTSALAASPNAKGRLACALVCASSSEGVKQGDADKLMAAWKKAGIAQTKLFREKTDSDAVRKAVEWLLARDRAALQADIDKLLARADKLAATQSGDALTIYRRIAGSGLKDPKVGKAVEGVKKLLTEAKAVVGQLTTRRTEMPADQVIALFNVTQRFQGTPEGSKMLYMIRSKLEAQ